MKKCLFAVAIASSLATMLCLVGSAQGDVPQPPIAVDQNPDPGIVEVTLIADETTVNMNTGRPVNVCAFNGSVPGPTIEANVGDTVVVHFFNQSDNDLTVHWHGVEVPANMDGSNISQPGVPPGGYYRYEFTVNRASLFWYHPHLNTNVMVEKGLYGALIVRDTATDAELSLPTQDQILIMDDILLDGSGQIIDPFPQDPLLNAETQHNGREGNVLLVNGQSFQRAFPIAEGVPQRLRLVNVANSRFMRLKMPGQRMYRIGGDQGLLESAIEVDADTGLLLTPGERADIVFTPTGNKQFLLEWHDLPRGRHMAFYRPDGGIGLAHDETDGQQPAQTLLRFQPTGSPKDDVVPFDPSGQLGTITPIDTTNAGMIVNLFGHTPPDADGNLVFFVQLKNGMPLPFWAVTPDDAPVVAVGDTVVWQVHNLTAGHHNFHLHGFTFQLIETQFVDLDNPDNNFVVSAPYLEDKDTLFIPRRTGARGRSRSITRLAVRFDDTGRSGQVQAFGKQPTESTSGGWVFHCHILEHSNRGMMSFLQVIEP